MNDNIENNEINNPKQTPTIKGGPGMMNGNETGIPFSSDRQPDPEAKRRGWAKKRALTALLKIKAPGGLGTNKTDYAQLAADFLGLPKDEVSIEVIMHFRQMEKAILKADTYAYESVMNRAKGKPAQALTGANGTPLVPPEHKVIHVHSDIPLAENEEDVQA